ncbi:hypothetical protein N836_30345 [Leptolyngbya sp. Heron Island J]|uniref:hypothetical protein n=1 Tax=Leptolyngbya sp. Heron Island J TaxID=1385935 RepID=UPI0003B9A704|nr:hypothetical protein [Leptolyngbya sp. Heron Island J]ESA38830.1 hypothetical protein N836_30345 [Leptolyngbya sp. Heron Island J]
MFQTEFEFSLPKGYYDGEGNLHRKGKMRLAKAADEITPMRDPRVKANPAYATVLVLSRVVIQLGALSDITPRIIEDLYAADLNYLYTFYREINDLPPLTPSAQSTSPDSGEADGQTI